MADTISDRTLTGGWQDAFSLSGLTVGQALLIQNKASVSLLVVIAPTAPSASSTSGWWLKYGEAVEVDAGESGCWLKGNGSVCIQQG